MKARWTDLLASARYWDDGLITSEYARGMLHPSIAKQLYSAPSEELMDLVMKSMMFRSHEPNTVSENPAGNHTALVCRLLAMAICSLPSPMLDKDEVTLRVLGSREEEGMGNAVCAKEKKKKTAKVMTLDGAVIRLKPPAAAGDVLRDHPGHSVLEADEVKRLGVRAMPLDATQPLEPGKLYFLAELPRPPNRHGLRRASSVVAAARGSATDRLENLRLSRPRPSASLSVETAEGGGAVRVRMRLPAARVAKLLQESADGSEAAERIVELYLAEKSLPVAVSSPTARKEVSSA
ncbi:hypothetical protein B296_00050420 [Ensete ventricosum]|uniref:Uncharacterized protein n=1 Tax=Ensete ventricosum TaxID=4639 RepID=A0A426XKZ8_ENSVE|nr:hypothetical protein B296_00050420 [Ensete ventricosum]